MPKVSPIQSSFQMGEVSPLYYGRVRDERYQAAVATCENYLTTTQGAVVRRPGTQFIGEVRDSSKFTRLIPFRFSTLQAYVLEFSDGYLRVFRNYAAVLSGSAIYERPSPYIESDLAELRFVQSADVLFIVHPRVIPTLLTRSGHASWSFTGLASGGPYLGNNADASLTLVITKASAPPGFQYTITANRDLFTAKDEKRWIRFRDGTTWRYLFIFSVTNATTAVSNVTRSDFATLTTSVFAMGAWYTGNYPAAITFHEDRLVFSGYPDYPQRVDLSASSDYTNFFPSETDGTVLSSSAISLTMNASEVNAGRWLVSDEKGLISGSTGAEWVVKPAASSAALSATNLAARKATSFGSAAVQPVQIGKATIFVQGSGRKLREFRYYYDVDGHDAQDISKLSEHITMTGVREICYQKEPFPILWAIRNDGRLAAATYEREGDNLTCGWHRHTLGGVGDAAGGPPVVESGAVIPSPDGTREDLWLIVRRWVNGQSKRYIEVVSRVFDSSVPIRDAKHLDCSLTLDAAIDVASISKAAIAVVTANSHGFVNGNEIIITDATGMTEVNLNVYKVAAATTNTFQLEGVDSTQFKTYVSGGKVRKRVNLIMGLSHLEGQKVSVFGDGMEQPSKTVSGGSIYLDDPAAVVNIGLPYNSDLKLLRIEAGAADGAALGKTRRTNKLCILVHRTLGLKYGTDFEMMDAVQFPQYGRKAGHAPKLFSGIAEENFPADYDKENQIALRQSGPFPGMILAIMPQMTTQDR